LFEGTKKEKENNKKLKQGPSIDALDVHPKTARKKEGNIPH